jgi:cytochrome c oxidase subunit II
MTLEVGALASSSFPPLRNATDAAQLAEVHRMTLTRKLVVFGFISSLTVYSALSGVRADSPQLVKITASKFSFTPDHITLIKGQPVTLQFTTTDATHGFLIYALNMETAIRPGTVTQMTVTPTVAGTFKAICDRYCGLGHSRMKMTVVVQEAAAKASPEHLLTATNTISRLTESQKVGAPRS